MTKWILLIAFSSVFWPQPVEAGWKPLTLQRNQARKQLQPRKIGLVIGINQTKARYWSPLMYAKKDAVRMSQTLRKIAQFDQIMMRVRRNETTKAAIIAALQVLKARVKSPMDTVFVYVSAHGTVAYNPKTKRQERYIVTSDTGKQTANTAINVKELVKMLQTTASRKVVLMLATCYTGTPRSKSRTKPGQKGVLGKKIKPLQTKALQILSAAGFAQAAYESTKLQSDVYTHYFLDCLRKLKRNKANVSAIDAHACATQPTTKYVKRYIQEIQVPGVDSLPGSNRDVFLYQKKRQRKSMGYFWGGRKNPQARYELFHNANPKGRYKPVYYADPGEYIMVRPGRYKVVVRDMYGRVIRYYTITVRREHTTYLKPEMQSDPNRLFDSRSPFYQRTRHPWVIVGYAVGTTALVGASVYMAYGFVLGDGFAVIGGGMGFGAGALIFISALIADVAQHRSQRKIQYLRSISSKTTPPKRERVPPPPTTERTMMGRW